VRTRPEDITVRVMGEDLPLLERIGLTVYATAHLTPAD
jgi:hypothetical protein